MAVEWQIEALSRVHDRTAFVSGRSMLDDFLRSLVTQYEKRNLGRTYVAVRAPSKRVFGYYTLASGAVAFQSMPKKASRKLPKHPVPVALLGRLAVDQSVQGQGLGEILLVDALRRCADLSSQIGIHAVEVHAIDAVAKSFYEKYGFLPHLDDEFRLYLPIATVQQR